MDSCISQYSWGLFSLSSSLSFFCYDIFKKCIIWDQSAHINCVHTLSNFWFLSFLCSQDRAVPAHLSEWIQGRWQPASSDCYWCFKPAWESNKDADVKFVVQEEDVYWIIKAAVKQTSPIFLNKFSGWKRVAGMRVVTRRAELRLQLRNSFRIYSCVLLFFLRSSQNLWSDQIT